MRRGAARPSPGPVGGAGRGIGLWGVRLPEVVSFACGVPDNAQGTQALTIRERSSIQKDQAENQERQAHAAQLRIALVPIDHGPVVRAVIRIVVWVRDSEPGQ